MKKKPLRRTRLSKLCPKMTLRGLISDRSNGHNNIIQRISQLLVKYGLRSRRVPKKPLLTRSHTLGRLKWCEGRQKNSISDQKEDRFQGRNPGPNQLRGIGVFEVTEKLLVKKQLIHQISQVDPSHFQFLMLFGTLDFEQWSESTEC